MEIGNHLILGGASLVLLSIFAGQISSRVGAPLLLVFLGLGMLAGEDGPGQIQFDNFRLAYLFGSVSLAVILFDGGLRTRYENFRIAMWPALMLATVGVLVTAGITAFAAQLFVDLNWLEALLVGSIVASTDAAAVFLLLHLNGMGLQRRVGATLELESGINDPMAVFLTIACVELLAAGATAPTPDLGLEFLREFAIQMLGGAVIGVLGGYALAAVINRLAVAPGPRTGTSLPAWVWFPFGPSRPHSIWIWSLSQSWRHRPSAGALVTACCSAWSSFSSSSRNRSGIPSSCTET